MAKSPFDKNWIIEKGIPIIESYDNNLTLRALHYRLVALGMINDIAHYKKVVQAMTFARWEGLVSFDSFLDHERSVLGETKYYKTNVRDKVIEAKKQINLWSNIYRKNRWENQPNYVEVFIEKKALQGVFEPVCQLMDVALSPCKGYPSLTFQYEAAQRFLEAEQQGKNNIILYFGDYDPSGEDIPRSIKDTLRKMGAVVNVVRVALMHEQVISWNLPPAPTKSGDTRSVNWDGIGQVELDAVEPDTIKGLCKDAIDNVFDYDLYSLLTEVENVEIQEFKAEIRKDFDKLI